MRRSGLWLPLGALIGGAIAFAGAWQLAGDDFNHVGDWRGGAGRFIGMMIVLGGAVGYFVALRVTRGVAVTRDGFTLSYRAIDPVAHGYRELTTLTVTDLLTRLRAAGYEPTLQACNELGQRVGATDSTTPLAGANVAIADPGVRGWIRIQLPPQMSGQTRAIGIVEVWSERGESAAELGLFALRALDELIGQIEAARESSRLSGDPVDLLTAGLADKAVHRRAI